MLRFLKALFIAIALASTIMVAFIAVLILMGAFITWNWAHVEDMVKDFSNPEGIRFLIVMWLFMVVPFTYAFWSEK